MPKKIPAVPTDASVGTRNWMHGVSKRLDTIGEGGSGGPGVDHVVRSDVKKLIKRVDEDNKKIGDHDNLLGKGGAIDYTFVPPKPTSFSITSVGERIGLNWTFPDDYGPGLGHMHTIIYKTPAIDENDELIDVGLVSPLTEQSYRVGLSELSHFSDIVGYNEAFYYWIQFESTGGVRGIVSDVVLGQTDVSISQRMKDASDYIDSTSLAQDLRDNINTTMVGEVGETTPPTVKRNNQALSIGDIWVQDTGQVWIYLDPWTQKSMSSVDISSIVTSEVAEELTTYALDDLAIIWYSSDEPTITSHPKLAVDDIWVNTSTASSDNTGDAGKIYRCTSIYPTAVFTEIKNESLTKALADASNAKAAADGKIQFFAQEGDPSDQTLAIPLGWGDMWLKPASNTEPSKLQYWNNTTLAWVDTLLATESFAAAKVTETVTELVGYCRSPNADYNGEYPVWTAYDNKTACEAAWGVWEDNGALAQKLSSIHTTVDANYTSLTQDFVSKNGISGKYSVKMDNNGVVSGFGLSSGPDGAGVVSDFIINADNFALLGKKANGESATDSTDAINPFMITRDTDGNGNLLNSYTTHIDSALIDTAEIANLTVTSLANMEAITVAGGQFTSQYIDPDGNQAFSITNLKIDNGHIVGTLSSNSWSSSAKTGWKLSPDGSAYFGSDTVIDGTVSVLAIDGNAKVADASYGYLMPLVTSFNHSHPSATLDGAWLWHMCDWTIVNTVAEGGFPLLDPPYYVGGASTNYWGTGDFPHTYNINGPGIGLATQFYYMYARDYPFGNYNTPVAQWPNTARTGYQAAWGGNYVDSTSAEFDNKTINEVSSVIWFGTSGYLDEGLRIKSASPVINLSVAESGTTYGEGNGGFGTLSYNALIPFRLHVRYATMTSATTMVNNSGWMEYPRDIAAALGGSYSGRTWYAPQLPNNLVFILGSSSRNSAYDTETAFGTTGFGSLGVATANLYTNRFAGGPRVPASMVTQAAIISIQVDNL